MTFCQTITKLYILRLFSCHCQKTPTCAALRERVEGAASEQLSSYPPHCLQRFHRSLSLRGRDARHRGG